MTDDDTKWATFRAEFERHFVDPDTGLIFSYLDRSTHRPAADDVFADAIPDSGGAPEGGASLAELYLHENCGMTTGAYLVAEILRHERCGAADALDNARRAFHALEYVFDVGQRHFESGFFPKLYGGRFSRETSTDQVLYACYAFEAFAPHATPDEHARLARRVGDAVDFWMRRDYRYPYFRYFGADWQWPLVRFPALLRLAHDFTDDPRFQREYERLLPETRAPEHADWHRKRHAGIPPDDYERANHAWLTAGGADRVTMDTMELDILLRRDPANRLAGRWRENLRIIWDEVKDAVTPDGRYYSMTLFDLDTGELRRTPGFAADGTRFHGAKSSWSAMVARAGLQARAHVPDLPEAERVALCVLDRLDFDACTYYDEPERFPPGQRYKTRLLSGDAATNLLWCRELHLKKAARERAPRQPALAARL